MPTHPGQQHQDELTWRMSGSVLEIADILTEFADELRRGDVNVWKGQRNLELHPNHTLELQVDAVTDPTGRQGLQLNLRWG
jgi:amphi-Trp domain-containing protein